MSAPGSINPLDPSLFPALYDQIRVEKDAEYWKERMMSLYMRVKTIIRTPATPLTRLALLDDLLREYHES